MNVFISIILFLFFFPVYAKTLKTLPLVDGKQVSIVKEKECYYWHKDEGNKKPLACVDDELESGFTIKDYNFDGYQDISIYNALGMVNNIYYIFIYDYKSKEFRKIKIANPTKPISACGEFYNLDVQPKTLTLFSTCRSGPVWYYDVYRYNDQGELWLYKTTEYQIQNSEIDTFPLYEITFNQNGEQLDKVAIDFDGKKFIWSIKAEKVFLYFSPEKKSKTKAYLIRNDKVEILAQKDDWIQISYASRKGPLVSWLSLVEATREG